MAIGVAAGPFRPRQASPRVRFNLSEGDRILTNFNVFCRWPGQFASAIRRGMRWRCSTDAGESARVQRDLRRNAAARSANPWNCAEHGKAAHPARMRKTGCDRQANLVRLAPATACQRDGRSVELGPAKLTL